VAGISDDDRLSVCHSTARRKGLSIVLVRRMKHAYPRAIDLVAAGRVALAPLVSHRFPLGAAAEAFRTAADYADRSVKVLVDIGDSPC
jgi:L-iditol 2-dehydrogenase